MNFFEKLFYINNKKQEQKVVTKGMTLPPTVSFLGNSMPEILSLDSFDNLLNAYYRTPEFAAIVNYSADNFPKVKTKLYQTDKEGNKIKEVENHRILDITINPNVLQNRSEQMSQFYAYWKIYGNSLMFRPVNTGFNNIKDYDWWLKNIFGIWNISPALVNIKTKPNVSDLDILYSTSINDLILGYDFNNNSDTLLSPEDVKHVNDTGLQWNNGKVFWGDSRAKPISLAISNLIAGYEARNVFLTKRGALGILSNDTKDKFGAVELDDPEIIELQKKFRNYGLNKKNWQIVITNASLKWQQMALPIKELQILEGQDSDKRTVCDAYKFPILLLNELSGSTFNNMDTALKMFYQNMLIPDWNTYHEALNELFKTKENGLILCPDWSHVEVLQADITKKYGQNEILTKNIQAIQNDIDAGIKTYETGLNILIEIWNVSTEVAEMVINEPTERENITINNNIESND